MHPTSIQAYNHEAYKHSKLKNMQKGQFQIKNCIDWKRINMQAIYRWKDN